MRLITLAAIAASLKVAGGSGPPATYATFNPNDMRSGIVLSNGNLTATVGSGLPNGLYGVRATAPKVTGKHYYEVHVDTLPAGSPEVSIGLASQFQDLGWYSNAASQQSFACRDSDGIVVQNDSNLHSGVGGGFVEGNTIGLAIDYDLRKYWYTKNGTVWNGESTATQNPATGVGGLSFDSNGLAWRYPWVYGTPGTQWTVNFGATAFTYCPAGFTGYEENTGKHFWRINVTSPDGSPQVSITEAEMALTAGGANLLFPTMRLWGSPSLESFGWFMQYAVDGNKITNGTASGPNGWNSYPSSTGYIAFALGADTAVAEVRIWPRSDSTLGEAPKDFTIESSPDGRVWTVEKTVTGSTGWTLGTPRTFSIP